MKVILLQDVARIGRQHEIKEVPDGHALNFLIPKKLAEPATPANVKRVTAHTNQKKQEKVEVMEVFLKTRSDLKNAAVSLAVEANEKGHLFKGLKAEDIATHISKEVGPLSADQIMLAAPIKEVGEHTITITSGEEEGTFILSVIQK